MHRPTLRSLARVASAALLLALTVPAHTQYRFQPVAEHPDHAALGLVLRQLGTVGSLMMSTAHPDDENTALLARYRYQYGMRTTLVSATRGNGGQNEIGPEIFESLAVLRTEELLAAHRVDGAEQYFARAVDFGFSFSRDETFQRWDREKILEDYVYWIRTIRPGRHRRLRLGPHAGWRAAPPGVVAHHRGGVPRGGGCDEVPRADRGRAEAVAGVQVLLHGWVRRARQGAGRVDLPRRRQPVRPAHRPYLQRAGVGGAQHAHVPGHAAADVAARPAAEGLRARGHGAAWHEGRSEQGPVRRHRHRAAQPRALRQGRIACARPRHRVARGPGPQRADRLRQQGHRRGACRPASGAHHGPGAAGAAREHAPGRERPLRGGLPPRAEGASGGGGAAHRVGPARGPARRRRTRRGWAVDEGDAASVCRRGRGGLGEGRRVHRLRGARDVRRRRRSRGCAPSPARSRSPSPPRPS